MKLGMGPISRTALPMREVGVTSFFIKQNRRVRVGPSVPTTPRTLTPSSSDDMKEPIDVSLDGDRRIKSPTLARQTTFVDSTPSLVDRGASATRRSRSSPILADALFSYLPCIQGTSREYGRHSPGLIESKESRSSSCRCDDGFASTPSWPTYTSNGEWFSMRNREPSPEESSSPIETVVPLPPVPEVSSTFTLIERWDRPSRSSERRMRTGSIPKVQRSNPLLQW
mmetsp:Transcript_853/g.1995  ORF Transcript_853/g.1995 Transcript_853/m.1995 type:complete len:226 (-) Transcript_853:675-1352(-)